MTLLIAICLKLALTFLILYLIPYAFKESIFKSNKKARKICGWIASIFMALVLSSCLTAFLAGIWQIGA